MKTILLLLTLAGIVSAGPADEKAVKAAFEKFNAAVRSGDQATLDKLLHPDLIYAHSNAKVENKAECIQALVSTKPNFVMAPGLTVRVYGNTAILHGRATARVSQNGQTNEIPLDLLQVWLREGKDWRMVARHTTRVP